MNQEAVRQENVYDFVSPGRIVFGWGRRREIGHWGSTLGSKAIWIQGSRTLTSSGIADSMKKSLRATGVDILLELTISHEPRVADVDQALLKVQQTLGISFAENGMESAAQGDAAPKTAGVFIVAVGGGSAIDMGKAIAALTVNCFGLSVLDYLEGVGTGATIQNAPLPVLAIPTTAGTGAEATKNAVISSNDTFISSSSQKTDTNNSVDNPTTAVSASKFKKSLRHDGMIPRIAIVDPELTVSCPSSVTASCGMDALTQLIESFISNRAKPIPQALAIQGLGLIWNSLEVAVADPDNQDAREQLSHAALLSGLCLANSGLGMAHGIAAAMGIHANIPHGRACGCLLPLALEINKQKSLAELSVLANFLLPPSRNYGLSRVDELIQRIKSIQKNVGIEQKLSELGIQREQIPLIARDSRGSSMNGNPRTLTEQELTEALEKIF